MFTARELEYLSDRDFLLTKRRVIDKVVHSFAELEKDLKQLVITCGYQFPPDAFLQAGKISKGENYRGLPYVILDYPRLFSHDAIFAYRTMFWWGNFFSNTLHVSGSALQYLPVLKKSPEPLYIQCNGEQWDHSLASAQRITANKKVELVEDSVSFVKISQKIPLSEYNTVKHKSADFFGQLFN